MSEPLAGLILSKSGMALDRQEAFGFSYRLVLVIRRPHEI